LGSDEGLAAPKPPGGEGGCRVLGAGCRVPGAECRVRVLEARRILCPDARFGCRAEKGFRPPTPACGLHPHPAGVAATGVSVGGGDAARSLSVARTQALARLQYLFCLTCRAVAGDWGGDAEPRDLSVAPVRA
jgi:hypothetical protein